MIAGEACHSMTRTIDTIPMLRLSEQRVIGPPDADAEEALVFLAARVLARFGHSVSGVTDPRAALEAFGAHPRA